MPVDTQSYRLLIRGKPVGTHVLKQETRGRTTALEGRLLLQGSLGSGTITQMSRCHRERFFSFAFREITAERSEHRTFELDFDAREGLVRATRDRERATVPYLLPYRDPLSLLHEVRSLPTDREHHRVPMLGKEVVVQLAGEVALDTIFGERRARAYRLHPGGSLVYVDSEPPHTILKLTQRLEEHLLDALLVRVGTEAEMAPWSEGEPSRRKKTRKRRRRRRGSGARRS